MNTHISMIDVIRMGASKRAAPCVCPFCGENPPLARMVKDKFVVGCESDTCPACPEVRADTLEGVWLKWNARA